MIKNDKPKAPFTGNPPIMKKMRNTIEDIIQTYIDPIVFVDVNTCVSKGRPAHVCGSPIFRKAI